MARRPRPPFLPRHSYRLRRLHDAARLLPLFGLFFLILPILWSPASDDPRRTATDGLYLFGIWVLMILAAAIFARHLLRGGDGDMPGDPGADPEGGGRDGL